MDFLDALRELIDSVCVEKEKKKSFLSQFFFSVQWLTNQKCFANKFYDLGCYKIAMWIDLKWYFPTSIYFKAITRAFCIIRHGISANHRIISIANYDWNKWKNPNAICVRRILCIRFSNPYFLSKSLRYSFEAIH